MRLHPDTRERSNKSTAPTATTEANPPAPERPLGPQPLPALVYLQRYHAYRTLKTMHCPIVTSRPRSALRRNAPAPQCKLLGQHKFYFITEAAPVTPECRDTIAPCKVGTKRRARRDYGGYRWPRQRQRAQWSKRAPRKQHRTLRYNLPTRNDPCD